VCFKSRVKKGVIDGDRGGDDSVDPTCSEKVKDQDVDEAYRKSERVYSKGRVLHIGKNVVILILNER